MNASPSARARIRLPANAASPGEPLVVFRTILYEDKDGAVHDAEGNRVEGPSDRKDDSGRDRITYELDSRL